MQKRKLDLLFTIVVYILPLSISAQSINGELCQTKCNTNAYWEAGINVGVSAYTGHINPENPDAIANPWHNQPDLAVGGFLQYHINQYLGVEAELLTTRLSGKWNTKYPFPIQYNPSEIPVPAPTFKTGLTRYSLSFVGYINRLFMSPKTNPRVDAYIKAGIGQVTLNPMEYIEYIYKPDNRRRTVYPFAVGAQWHLACCLNIGLEAQWNLVNTDRLDALQDVHVDPNTGKVDYGYFNAMEHFGAVTVNLSYRFGNKQFLKY